MKSVLLSIQPKWCKLIFSGEKTIEVRKTAPKLETPFKVYVYCTKERMTRIPSMYAYLHKNEPRACAEYGTIETWGEIGDVIVNPHLASKHVSFGMHGKVIGSFVCDKTYDFFPWGAGVGCTDKNENLLPPEIVVKETCLTEQQIIDYLENGNGTFEGYGWHITSPKLFDNPRELKEFKIFCEQKNYGGCPLCGCSDMKFDEQASRIYYVCNRPSISNPPQSWRYVDVDE